MLAIRAWLGTNVKSEILYYLTKNNKSYANEIAKKLNFSYPPVYLEVHSLIKNGIIETENIGNITLIYLKKKSKSLKRRMVYQRKRSQYRKKKVENKKEKDKKKRELVTKLEIT